MTNYWAAALLGCVLALVLALLVMRKQVADVIEAPTTRKAVVWMTPDRVSVIWIQANNWSNQPSLFTIPAWVDKQDLARAVWKWAQEHEQ